MAKPLSRAGPDFVQRLSKLSTAVEKGKRDTLQQAALEAKRVQVDEIRRDTGDGRLSGVGKRGAKVGARFDFRGDGQVVVKATGPLHFVANPMSPHRIPKLRTSGRRRFIVIPGVGVRANAMHPGTRGKNTWVDGRRQAEPKITKVMQSETANIVKRGFS
ncbi:MAG: hypothetical protein ABIO83_02135 [Ilumatobacteraceae bacterium]